MYLWYSVVLLSPGVHELGHYTIGLVLGQNAVSLQWNVVYWSDVLSPVQFLIQGVWEWCILVPLVCVLLWAYLMIKNISVSRSSAGEGAVKLSLTC